MLHVSVYAHRPGMDPHTLQYMYMYGVGNTRECQDCPTSSTRNMTLDIVSELTLY